MPRTKHLSGATLPRPPSGLGWRSTSATGKYSTVLLLSEGLNQRRITGPQLDPHLCAAENELAETEAPTLRLMAGSGHDGNEVNGRLFGNKSVDYTSSTLELAFDLRSLDCTALQLNGRNPVSIFLDLGKKQIVTPLLVLANRCTSPIQVDYQSVSRC